MRGHGIRTARAAEVVSSDGLALEGRDIDYCLVPAVPDRAIDIGQVPRAQFARLRCVLIRFRAKYQVSVAHARLLHSYDSVYRSEGCGPCLNCAFELQLRHAKSKTLTYLGLQGANLGQFFSYVDCALSSSR